MVKPTATTSMISMMRTKPASTIGENPGSYGSSIMARAAGDSSRGFAAPAAVRGIAETAEKTAEAVSKIAEGSDVGILGTFTAAHRRAKARRQLRPPR